MSIREEFIAACDLREDERSWLIRLLGNSRFLADLADSDVIFWGENSLWDPQAQEGYTAISHQRPPGTFTFFHRDFVSRPCPEQWLGLLRQAESSGQVVSEPSETPEVLMQSTAVPVFMPRQPNAGLPAAELRRLPVLITAHSLPNRNQQISEIQSVYQSCAQDVFQMITTGCFPGQNTALSSGSPRASDGLIRIDRLGKVIYASPKSLSIFEALGWKKEIEGHNLAEIVAGLVEKNEVTVDEALPLVTTGRADWQAEMVALGTDVMFRSVPIWRGGSREGAIVLCRDITERRTQELELMTRDATIREVHHRVKNNLQTVISMLSTQQRRCESAQVKAELGEALRRIGCIALVHNTLSGDLSESLDFDEIFRRVMALVVQNASSVDDGVELQVNGNFGSVPSRYASPLALVVAELISNAVEHGLQEGRGRVIINCCRHEEFLYVLLSDSGVGIAEIPPAGLGGFIVRTLVQAELHGRISWHHNPYKPRNIPCFLPAPELAQGTTVMIRVRLSE